MATSTETTEKVAQFDDLKDGEMRQVKVGSLDVLLVRVDGEYHAMGAHCTHYGAPLVEGVLSGKHVICPWHHAVYDVTSGDHIEPPGRDCLTSFAVAVDGTNVNVTVLKDDKESRLPHFCKPRKGDDREIGIVGAGAAASMAAETLRKSGYTGKITMMTYEDDFPYDRPNVSKDYLMGEAEPSWMPLRSAKFYADHGISIVFGRRVMSVDVNTKEVIFDDDETRTFDMLLLATGGIPRQLPVPHADGAKVILLHSMNDANSIIERLKNIEGTPKVVVVGSSFIGLEVAQSLRHRGVEVAVATIDEIPFEKTLGRRVGNYVKDLHSNHGVDFHLGAEIARIEHFDRTTTVVLADETRLDADLVIVGIGVRPATDYVRGIKLNKDGSITVDSKMQVCEGVFAAGDIARFPSPQTGESIRVEHWRLANQHGQIAGYNMAGKETDYQEVPFFWTQHYGVSLRYVGHAQDWDTIAYEGTPESGDFIAYYMKNGQTMAACGTRDHALAQIHAQYRNGQSPRPPMGESSFDSAQV